jgi:C4-dicarboxylate transporter DctQ subunit
MSRGSVPMRWLKSFNDFFDRPVIVITDALLIMAVVLVCVEVFTRYVLGISQAFLDELSKYSMVWFVYLILGIISKERAHVKIEILSRYLKGKSHDVADIIFHFSVVVICVIVGWGMISSIHFFYLSGQTPVTQVALPEWTVRLILPVGLFLMMLRNIELIIEGVLALSSKKKPEPTGSVS